MLDSLAIKDTHTLSELSAALSRFASDIQQAMRVAQAQIQRTLEWLDERLRYWGREVDRAYRLLQEARAGLSRCEGSGYRDEDGYYHQPDCSGERAELRQAEEHLRLCQENLKTAQVWRSRVNQSADAYYREAKRLQDVTGGRTEKARAELGTLEQKYEAVRQAQVAAGIAEAIAGGVLALGAALASQLSDSSSGEVGLDDLQPNATYRRGAYEFQTDEYGRPKSVYGKLELKEGNRSRLQGEVGRLGLPTDEGGHLLGTRFDGPSDAFNLVPQDSNLNRGAWKAMENSWADALRSGREVRVMIDPIHRSAGARPTAFQVVYQIDMGNPQYCFFRNRPA